LQSKQKFHIFGNKLRPYFSLIYLNTVLAPSALRGYPTARVQSFAYKRKRVRHEHEIELLEGQAQVAPDCEGRKRPEPNEDFGIDLMQARSNENEKIKTWEVLAREVGVTAWIHPNPEQSAPDGSNF
jgi:hypothetical protein